nr:urea ABC transporter permease subunit UrtB [Chitinasiproducens palmae]
MPRPDSASTQVRRGARKRLLLGVVLSSFALTAGASAVAEQAAPAQSATLAGVPGNLSVQALTALAGDEFDARSQAVDTLIASRDPRAADLLRALADDRVLADDAGHLYITEGDVMRDPLSGRTVQAGNDAQPVALPNTLRARVAGAAQARQLGAADRATRAAAIDALLANPDPTFKAWVDAARAGEHDSALRRKLDTLWAMTALHDADPAVRLHATELVATRGESDSYELLRPLTGKAANGAWLEADARVRAAAQRGLDRLDTARDRAAFVGTVFAGLSLGSVLLLAALGLAITYGLIGVINMAHGELLMIGAYTTYVTQNAFQRYWPGGFDWYLLAAVPAAFLVTALIGAVIERLVLRQLYGRPLETLLTTFGISLLLMQGVRVLFGAQNVQVRNPSWMSGGGSIMQGLILPYNRVAIIAFSALVVAIAWLVLTRTRLGLFVRAVTQNRRMAACVGVRTGLVDSYAFAFGAGIAGLGGCALSQIGNVGPDLGQNYIIDSFMAVVLGGVGQLAGTIVGSLGLGLVSKGIEPFWGAVLAKIVVLVLVVLFIQRRPQGMFALKGRSAEA